MTRNYGSCLDVEQVAFEPLDAPQHTVVVQKWEESERGWGTRPWRPMRDSDGRRRR